MYVNFYALTTYSEPSNEDTPIEDKPQNNGQTKSIHSVQTNLLYDGENANPKYNYVLVAL